MPLSAAVAATASEGVRKHPSPWDSTMRWCQWHPSSDVALLPMLTNVFDRHLKYTIPPAIILTLIHCPFCTRLDLYKILFLISVRKMSPLADISWDPSFPD